jgi:hypothetical protein
MLGGLRVNRNVARQVFRGVQAMRESDTFMAILEEGEEKEAKSVLLRLGKKRFGEPDEAIAAHLTAITDLERLHRLQEHMFEATGWHDLLDTP